jgi:hypothetical protein
MQKLLKRAQVLLGSAPIIAALVVAANVPQARAQQDPAPLFAEQANADRMAQASQKRIDQIQDQTQDMAGRYRQTLADEQSINKYNEQLREQVKDQAERLNDMNRQIQDIETTQRDVLPLMERMVSTLEQFVKLDVPFLIDERTQRVETLKGVLTRADVSNSEKYRRILEAYQIEMEYGRTLDSYEGKRGSGDEAKTVEFVRVGRVALMYQTSDGTETGYWDRNKKDWVVDDDYSRDVRAALAVAKKTKAPDLLMVAVPAPTQAKQEMEAKQGAQP